MMPPLAAIRWNASPAQRATRFVPMDVVRARLWSFRETNDEGIANARINLRNDEREPRFATVEGGAGRRWDQLPPEDDDPTVVFLPMIHCVVFCVRDAYGGH